jgi:hypothetical protein
LTQAANERDQDGPMTDEELATALAEMNRNAVGYLTDEVSKDQDDNLDRYLGEPYGDEVDGSSSAISMDVAEVVDWALPDLLEPFLAGDSVVEFEETSEQGREQAQQATDLVNHDFFSENEGMIILHDTVKTALIQKMGVIKTWSEKDETVEEHTLTGLTLQAYHDLSREEGVEVLEVSVEELDDSSLPEEAVQAGALAAFEDGKVYSASIRRTKERRKCKVESVPPEEVKVSQRSKNRNTEYWCHEREVTRGELLDMDFDQALVMGLPANKSADSESRRDNRFSDEQRQEAGHRYKMSDYVTLCEEYPLIDADGSGKRRRWQVFRVDKVILGREPVDDHPFDCWSPDRIPHRLIGLALADKVKQTQYIKTHLTRQMLDNVYLASNPRMIVPDSDTNEQTIDDLLTYRVGGLIRTKGVGEGIRPIEVPDRSATAMQAIIYMDGVREQQSGIVKNGMAVSSEVIDPKSATEARNEDRNEQVRKRLMIRMLAETLLVPVFQKMLKCIIKYQDGPRSVKIRGKFVEMDPKSWDANMKCKPAVGLGYANREEDLQAAQIIGQMQMIGAEHGIVQPWQMYETAKMAVRAVGWRFPERHFTDPRSPEGQQFTQKRSQQPDPAMAKVQGELQLKQQEMQARMAESQRDIELEMLKAKAKQAVEDRRADFDFRAEMVRINKEFEAKMVQIRAELALEAQQQAFERELARDQQAIDARNDAKAIEYRASNDREKVKSMGRGVRFGGKVG